MSSSTLLPVSDGLRVDHLTTTSNTIGIHLVCVAQQVCCPLCGQGTTRLHSRYERTLADLPWNQVAVRIHLQARNFFCDNVSCKRSIFTEPLPQLTARYARKTLRLQEAFTLVGYLLGGRARARLAQELGLGASADTLLRHVRQRAAKQATPTNNLRVLRVDDWAFRKGHRYGTILVDLERRCLAGLLLDRSAESVAAWLQQHPGVEIISRDRADVYADGARQGAPQARQVADRWHLLHNLGEAMQRLVAQNAAFLRQAVPPRTPSHPQRNSLQFPMPQTCPLPSNGGSLIANSAWRATHRSRSLPSRD